MSDTEGVWQLGYQRLEPGAAGALIGCAAVPVAMAALSTVLLLYRADLAAARAAWGVAAFLLALTTYLALVLKGELLSRLAGTRVEIAGGELRYHSPEGKLETVPLAEIERIEPGRPSAPLGVTLSLSKGRLGRTPTIAVVTRKRVVHMPGLGQPQDREWVMEAIRSAITRVSQRIS